MSIAFIRAEPLGLPPTMICPFCGSTYVHMDQVRIGARDEDEDARIIHVDAISSHVVVDELDSPPLSSRRHWIELPFWCEHCPGGSFIFSQHKGQTIVWTHETVMLADAEQLKRALALHQDGTHELVIPFEGAATGYLRLQ